MNRIVLVLVMLTLTAAVFGQSRIATLPQQKMCAEQAAKRFHEDNRDTSGTFKSHYDAPTNVCYLMVLYTDLTTHRDVISSSVYDAFEGRLYADYLEMHGPASEQPRPYSTGIMGCFVVTHGIDSVACHSRIEFQNLVFKYFGIAE